MRQRSRESRRAGSEAELRASTGSNDPKTVRVPAGKRELLTQQATGDTLELGILGEVS